MKTLLTLDEAFSPVEFEQTEAALFDMNKVGVYDPNFIPTVRQNLSSLDAFELTGELIPLAAFRTTRMSFQ